MFEKADVKFYYISLWLEWLGSKFGYLAVNLLWKLFDVLIGLKMAAFMIFEVVASSNFLNPKF